MPETLPEPVISVRDLVVGFDGAPVLNGLSLDVQAGEILGVVGGSGAGKSVLLRTIVGLTKIRSGDVRVLDVDLGTATERAWRRIERRWGILFQQGALFSSLTVKENVQFPMRQYLRLPQALMDDLAMAKLEMVGLAAGDAHKYPAELSGGMTKRVALARALALDPNIVFLDEPTSGLDPIAANAFDILIRALQRTLGITVFMVTHDLDTLASACDRIAALAEGHIVAIGPMSTMQASDHPWVREYFSVRHEMTSAPASTP
jgi:phospholipid/cholesterol/gamma-HCH transport system ATP-binding protein